MTITSMPIPTPWRTLGRTLLRFVYVLLAIALLWVLWYAYAAHRLNAKLAEYRSRGEPVTEADLVGPAVAPADNGYALAVSAADSLSLTPDEKEIVTGLNRASGNAPPFTDAEWATASGMLDSQGPILDLVLRARRASVISWPDQLPIYFSGASGSLPLAKLRQLANFCRMIALLHHHQHRDRLAMNMISDMRAISDVCEHGPFMIDHLIGISCESLRAETLLLMAPDLELQSAATPYGVPRERVVTLIRELLDEGPSLVAFRRSFMGEHVFDLVELPHIDQGASLFIPMFRLDYVASADQMDGYVRLLGTSIGTYPDMAAHFPKHRPYDNSNLHSAAHPLTAWTYSFDKCVELYCRGLVDRRAAALRLALRLYEIDHGKLPPDLAALVPDYLPAVPGDLLRSDGGAFAYNPARRIFYSVGKNGIDDGGETFSTSGSVNWNGPDVVFFLDGAGNAATSSATSAPAAR